MARGTGGRGRHVGRRKVGKYIEQRIAWMRGANLAAVLYVDDTKEEESTEPGPIVQIALQVAGRYYPRINLSDLTQPELEAFEQVVKHSIDLARPIVAMRDAAAKEAFDAGDDSFIRSYRRLPELVVRERKVSQHDEGVRVGPERVPEVDSQSLAVYDSVRGSGDGVVERVPSGGQAEDDEPQAD